MNQSLSLRLKTFSLIKKYQDNGTGWNLINAKHSPVNIEGAQLGNVTDFEYPGARIVADRNTASGNKRFFFFFYWPQGTPNEDQTLTQMNKQWNGQDLNLEIKTLKTCLYPTVMYIGMDVNLVLKKRHKNKINAIEIK